jgi:hypothetical protein
MDADLRINLNIDGTPITSRTHTHPSHFQTSRLLKMIKKVKKMIKND